MRRHVARLLPYIAMALLFAGYLIVLFNTVVQKRAETYQPVAVGGGLIRPGHGIPGFDDEP